LRKAAFSQGKFHDKVILGLLREEWEEEWAWQKEEQDDGEGEGDDD
jgi:hypothetical protein